MTVPLTRRALAAGLVSVALAPGPARAGFAEGAGRLGIAAVDTATGRRVGQREDERFAMCSTFKLVLVASVLARAERGELDLGERVPVRAEDVVSYAPVVERAVGRALTVDALCEAAVVLSDNSAANLLLDRSDGPAGWTRFARSLGDDVSRLDRREPELNVVLPGDPRDTTTPRAYLGLLERLLTGDALGERARRRLLRWLVRCETGRQRLRAGLPAGWEAGDKTGTGPDGETNDVAIVGPPGRAPWLVAAFYAHPGADGAARDATLADAARAVVAALTPPEDP